MVAIGGIYPPALKVAGVGAFLGNWTGFGKNSTARISAVIRAD